ncbi:hypothetical protein D9M68_768110 [compost metagenome]
MRGEAVLLAVGADFQCGLDQGSQGFPSEFLVSTEVLLQQVTVDAQVLVEHRCGETGFADVGSTRIAEIEVIHGREVVVLDHRSMHADGMGHLHRRIAIVLSPGSQHAAEHGDIHRRLLMQQRVQLFIARSTLFRDQGRHQRIQGGSLLRGDMHQLFDFQRVVLLHRAVHLGDLSGPISGLLFTHARHDQGIEGFAPQALGARPDITGQVLLEQFRGTPGALQALR